MAIDRAGEYGPKVNCLRHAIFKANTRVLWRVVFKTTKMPHCHGVSQLRKQVVIGSEEPADFRHTPL